MRAFFKQELETLYAKTQLRQYETISAMPDAANQFKILFDSLEHVCRQFSYIPELAQKNIIQERILSDKDFIGLNAKVVYKWFMEVRDTYFKQECHQKTEPEAEPVDYENLNPETKAKVDNLLRELSEPSKFSVPKINQHDIDVIKALDELRKGESIEQPKTNYEHRERLERNHALKIEYGKLFTESTYNGDWKLKEGAPTFEEWIKQTTL